MAKTETHIIFGADQVGPAPLHRPGQKRTRRKSDHARSPGLRQRPGLEAGRLYRQPQPAHTYNFVPGGSVTPLAAAVANTVAWCRHHPTATQ